MDRIWCFASPSTLLLALLLFPLPWVEVQCTDSRKPRNPLAKVGVPDRVAEVVAPRKRHVLFSQSGWQAVLGEWTAHDEENSEETEKERAEREHFQAELARAMKPAWPLTGCLLLAASGFVLSLGLWTGSKSRPILVGLCTTAALGFIGLQAAQGFPLEVVWYEVDWKHGPLEEKPPPTVAETEEFLREWVRYTGWLHLTWLLLAACVLLCLAEWCWWVRSQAATEPNLAPLEASNVHGPE